MEVYFSFLLFLGCHSFDLELPQGGVVPRPTPLLLAWLEDRQSFGGELGEIAVVVGEVVRVAGGGHHLGAVLWPLGGEAGEVAGPQGGRVCEHDSGIDYTIMHRVRIMGWPTRC